MTKPILIVLVVAALALATGCGSSSDSSSQATTASGKSATTVSNATPLTKAAFIKKGDAICEKTDEDQKTAIAIYTKKHPGNQSSTAWLTKMIAVAAVPPIVTEAEELRELGAPSGDEETIEAIIKGIEEATVKTEADPASVIKLAGNPYNAVGKMAGKYGFKACNQPL